LSFSLHIVLFWIFPFSASLNCLYFLLSFLLLICSSTYFFLIFYISSIIFYLFLFPFVCFFSPLVLPSAVLFTHCPDEQSSVSPRNIRSQLVVSRRTHPVHLVTV
jgi:hypothetical protein